MGKAGIHFPCTLFFCPVFWENVLSFVCQSGWVLGGKSLSHYCLNSSSSFDTKTFVYSVYYNRYMIKKETYYCLVWLCFMAYQTFVGYLMSTPVYYCIFILSFLMKQHKFLTKIIQCKRFCNECGCVLVRGIVNILNIFWWHLSHIYWH